MADAAAPPLSPEDRQLLQRRLLALNDGDMRLPDWDLRFVQDVCWRKPETLSPRQRQMVELLCWRHREQLKPELVPAKEPKIEKREPRRFADRPTPPRHRQRGPIER